jgi:hypothetical protein
MDITFTILLGLLLRIAVPVAITILVVILLHHLDKRWQKDAMELPLIPAGKPCWEIESCPIEKKTSCPVFTQGGKLCWQEFRNKDGELKEACLTCKVFRQAPIPVNL